VNVNQLVTGCSAPETPFPAFRLLRVYHDGPLWLLIPNSSSDPRTQTTVSIHDDKRGGSRGVDRTRCPAQFRSKCLSLSVCSLSSRVDTRGPDLAQRPSLAAISIN